MYRAALEAQKKAGSELPALKYILGEDCLSARPLCTAAWRLTSVLRVLAIIGDVLSPRRGVTPMGANGPPRVPRICKEDFAG